MNITHFSQTLELFHTGDKWRIPNKQGFNNKVYTEIEILSEFYDNGTYTTEQIPYVEFSYSIFIKQYMLFAPQDLEEELIFCEKMTLPRYEFALTYFLNKLEEMNGKK